MKNRYWLSTALATLVLAGCGPTNDSNELVGEPRYAIMYEIYDNEDSTSYLNLLDSLDIDTVDPKQGREFAGGRAFLETYEGAVYVGDPSSPIVTRYVVSETGKLEPAGAVSFANFGRTSGAIGSWSTNFVSPHKAYELDVESLTMIIWDPTTMEILGEVALPEEVVRDGVSTDASPAVARNGRLFRTFYWVNWDTAEYSTDQLLTVLDTETDEFVAMVPETRCGASGNLLQEDEDGNVYFGNWIWPVAQTVLGNAPSNCVLRLPAGGDRFDDFTFTYADVFDGREGAIFTYVGDGQALVSVFEDDDVTFDDTTDPWDIVSNPAWHVWSVDLATNEVQEVTGIPANTGAFTPVNLDGRLFLMVPGEDWATTTAYEVKNGAAERAFEIPGWSYQFRKIR